MGEENIFGIIDYCLFAGLLIISGGIGLYFSYIGSKSPEEYLLGNRSLRPLPVAMSLLTTYVSATSILGVSGEVYANGMQLWSLALGGPVGILFASYFVLPVLYPLRLTSINEYIELRFKSKKLRLAIFLALLTNVMIMSGLSLYAPTLAISSITKLNSLTNILLLGIICTIYSSFGGIKAVIWTDVFQLIVMVIGLITIVAIGIAQNGGFIEVLHTASQRGRLEIFDMSLSPFVKYTFVNSFLFGFFAQLRKHIMEQSCIQRLCSVQSIDKSRSVLNLHIAGKCIIYFLIFTGGLLCYVTYAGCDPMTMGIIKKKEQILSYFVMNKLNIFPGIPGLFVATLMAGSLSSLSSVINSCVALIWRDVCLKFAFYKTASRARATLTNKILSLVVGFLLIGIAIILSYSRSLIQIAMVVTGTFTGPALGVFLIGYFLPKCNLKGVWTGFIISSVLMLWLILGSVFYQHPSNMLSFSTEKCEISNSSSMNITRVEELNFYANGTTEDINSNTYFNLRIYHISPTLYLFIGPMICILLSVVVSCLTGNHKLDEVSPKLISPSVHKFYWTKEELKNFQEEENKMNIFTTDVKENNLENLPENLELLRTTNK